MSVVRNSRQRGARALALTAVAATVVIGSAAPADAIGGQFWVTKLQLAKAWQITKGHGVTVAVIDSGVPPVAGLRGRLLPGTNIATGGSGQTDRGEPSASGPFSHGQSMAELIAGTGAEGEDHGIAPAATILPVGVPTEADAGLSGADVGPAIRYAVDHHASVVNMSIGGSHTCDPTTAAAVKYAYQHDVILVAATGNNGSPTVEVPANCPGVLAVAGIDDVARPWSGSNYGSQVAFANFAVRIPSQTLTGGAGLATGTSPATAFTSGEVALLRAKFPHDTARQIVTRMLYTVDSLAHVTTGTRVNDHVGYGVPVPLAALTAHVPANAPNPIYDQWAKQLGPGSGNTTAPPSSTNPTGGTSAPAGATGTGVGGIGAGPIAAIAVVALLVIGLVGWLATRAHRRRPPGPPPPGYGGPPPPGYGGPPPPGYGGPPPPGYGGPPRTG